MNTSFLQELLGTIAEQGRQLLPRSLGGAGPPGRTSRELAAALLSVRGEASGVAIARDILEDYRALSPDERHAFLHFLAETLQPDPNGAARAAKAYLEHPEPAAMSALQAAVESPRQEFFRRLNLAPGATAEIVAMRLDLLEALGDEPALARVERRPEHLLSSWFNRGFLVLRRIDWQTPAAILEKIIAYEAVHEIQGWDDLRRRLDPADRRCFAFFHPSLIDEPLIFVEVALMGDIPDSIQSLLEEAPKNGDAEDKPTTAVFYSISNCQEGLRGISFGNFLIKQVVEDLVKERASLRTFVTLSPVPRFADWLEEALAHGRRRRAADHACRARRGLPCWRTRRGSHEPPAAEACAHCCSARGALFPQRQDRGRPTRRPGGALPSRQRRAPRAHQLAGGYLGKGLARGARTDVQLPLRAQGHREEPRGLRQRGGGRRLAAGACSAAIQVGPGTGRGRPLSGPARLEDGTVRDGPKAE